MAKSKALVDSSAAKVRDIPSKPTYKALSAPAHASAKAEKSASITNEELDELLKKAAEAGLDPEYRNTICSLIILDVALRLLSGRPLTIEATKLLTSSLAGCVKRGEAVRFVTQGSLKGGRPKGKRNAAPRRNDLARAIRIFRVGKGYVAPEEVGMGEREARRARAMVNGPARPGRPRKSDKESA